jgi:hypothetical protein
MLTATVRNTTIFIGLVICGAICAQAAPFMVSPRGAIGPTVLQAQTPVAAALAVVICLAVATAIAALIGRYTNAAIGTFVLGGGLYALAYQTATVEELAFSGGSLGLVTIETALWGVLVAGAVLLIYRVSGPLPDVYPTPAGDRPSAFTSRDAGMTALCGVLVLPAVWLIAQSPMKGQMVAAVLCGALLASLAARLLAPHVQPIVVAFIPMAFGVVGHVIGMLQLDGTLADAIVADTVPGLSMPMPIDYACGVLIGGPIGLNWAKSLLHQDEPTESAAPA